MRAIHVLATSACILSAVGCRGRGRQTDGDHGRIELTQDVTKKRTAEDVIFKNFKDNWRQFVSTAKELSWPVDRPEHEADWQPQVTSECVNPPGTRVLVPKVTLSWNQPPGEPQRVFRFDLVLHHDGFARDYYSSALSTDKLKRFNLPANSALVSDTEALMLTGPALFPLILDVHAENFEDRDTHRSFEKDTLVLRDLAPGMTYAIRLSRLAGERWQEEKRCVFSVPVCPSSF